MTYPNCGAEEERRAKREKEFEQTYGEQLRPIRRKQALVGGAWGALIGFLLYFLGVAASFFLFGQESFSQFWKELVKYDKYDYPFPSLFFWGLLLYFIIAFAVMGFLDGQRRESKQEKELRKNFGL